MCQDLQSSNDLTSLWDEDGLYCSAVVELEPVDACYWDLDSDHTIAQASDLALVKVLEKKGCHCPACLKTGEPTIRLDRVLVPHQSDLRQGKGIRFPVEFTQIVTPKVVRVFFEEDWNWPWEDDFEDVARRHRFRTDHDQVHVNIFVADGDIDVNESGNRGSVAVYLTVGKQVKPGDRVRLILQEQNEATGRWQDRCCLADAITICNLAEVPDLARYFGPPDWQVGEVGVFLDEPTKVLFLRIPDSLRESMRTWLAEPVVGDENLGINSRETALVAALVLLLYLKESFGDSVAEFFGDPVGFIKDRYSGYLEKEIEKATSDLGDEVKEDFRQTVHGEAVARLGKVKADKLFDAMDDLELKLNRINRVMSIVETVLKGAQLVARFISTAVFVDTVLRRDSFYSTAENYFFVGIHLDEDTLCPNGIVYTNMIPTTLSDTIAAALDMVRTQLLFWQSGNAWYIETLNIDQMVRTYTAARAKAETEGKDVCRICGSTRSPGLFFSDELDTTCPVCSQRYHESCLNGARTSWWGGNDCPRCLQRDVM